MSKPYFTILSCSKKEDNNPNTPTLASVSTDPVTSILTTTVTSGGIVISDGGSDVSARGVCWNTNTAPTIALSTKTNNGSGIGPFSSSVTDLEPGTTYYLRAYATNATGTAYGSEVNFVTPISIGSSYKGGKVAYILQTGDPGYIAGETHGFIATVNDISTSIQWYTNNTLFIGTTAITIGTGMTNTTNIVSSQGAGTYAAKLCSDLSQNGYDDWYLPSKDELFKLYINRVLIGGFTTNYYWSSSEVGGKGPYSNSVWCQDFDFTGYQSPLSKTSSYYVRAIRKF